MQSGCWYVRGHAACNFAERSILASKLSLNKFLSYEREIYGRLNCVSWLAYSAVQTFKRKTSMPFPVTISNILRLNVKTTVAVVIRGVAYMHDKYGEVYQYNFRFSSADALTSDTTGGNNFKLMKAFLEKSEILSVVLTMETVGVQPNECFIVLDVLPDENATISMRQLISHYLSSLASISFPETPYENSVGADGKDVFAVYNPLSTLAGGLFVVPVGFVIDPQTICLQIQPTAAVPTETCVQLRLRGQPIGSLYYSAIAAVAMLDSTGANKWFVTFAKNIPKASTIYGSAGIHPVIFDSLPIPDIKLFSGDEIQFDFLNVDTANSLLTMRYQQWISPI
jgi:hypothetical protein